MKNFPVFVFPVSLEFFLNARHTHKQLLTLYNPYDFSVYFKVLCTSPNKFTVIDPEGVIAPQSCIDIVVRFIQPSVSHSDVLDKFRITLFEKNSQQALGKRDVPVKIIEGEPTPTSSSIGENIADGFHSLPIKAASVKPAEEHPRVLCNHSSHSLSRPLLDICLALIWVLKPIVTSLGGDQQPINVVAVAISICCIAALLLPTQPEPVMQSQLPVWLHIGSNLKLVFSFVLGLVSMLVLRP